MEQDSKQMDEAASNRAYPLATRIQRLAAALLDDFIAVLGLIPVISYYDVFGYIEREQDIPMELIININIYAFVIFLLIHGFLLYKYGQTVGKRVLGIAISTLDYQVPEFNRMIALRYLPFRVAGIIPGLHLIPIADVLFIFHKDRRCLHDVLAKTQVIFVGNQTKPQPD